MGTNNQQQTKRERKDARNKLDTSEEMKKNNPRNSFKKEKKREKRIQLPATPLKLVIKENMLDFNLATPLSLATLAGEINFYLGMTDKLDQFLRQSTN